MSDEQANKPEVIVEQRGHMGILTLNRPKALNALTLNMVQLLTKQLLAWRDNDEITGIVVKGSGEKAFCAGGDIRLLYEGKGSKLAYARKFYEQEYQLNTLIKEYSKPYIAMIDGIVMGGGVGVSIHGDHRIAGDQTLFAMPETGIGFYPDVGGSFFLPRLPGKLGVWMALTGARLKAADALFAGVATDYAPSDQHAMILNRLCEDARHVDDIEVIIDSLTGLPAISNLEEKSGQIANIFGKTSIENIKDAMHRDGSEWADRQISILRSKSPTSLKVTLRQMKEGGNLDFRHCMEMELGLSMQFVANDDFYEGVRALLIDRDNSPKWEPDHFSDVSDDDVSSYFTPLAGRQALQFLD